MQNCTCLRRNKDIQQQKGWNRNETREDALTSAAKSSLVFYYGAEVSKFTPNMRHSVKRELEAKHFKQREYGAEVSNFGIS